MTVTQDQFRTAMMQSDSAVPRGLVDSQGAPAGRRFNVYRNNIAASLIEAMQQGFPVLHKLLGDVNFTAIALEYIRAHPPQSPKMLEYGQGFDQFLAAFEALSHIGYLPDMARLELLIRRAYHAVDSTPISPADIGAMTPETLENCRVDLAPSHAVLQSQWPIYGIWAFNMIEGAPKPTAGAEDILITRPGYDPEPFLLPQGGADVLRALTAGATLGQAIHAATAHHPDFDFAALLTLLLQGDVITKLTPTEDPS